MPRPRSLYLHREKTRHGRFVWYVRRGEGDRKRIRLHAEYGTPQFQAEYLAAIAIEPEHKARAVSAASLQWLYDQYRLTSAWQELSPSTRRQRENIFSGVMESAGNQPFAEISRRDIEDGKDRRRATPAQARNFLDAMRGLFRWALAAEHIEADPTANTRNPLRDPGEGFPVWSEDDIAAYEARWPLGTRQRVWLHVLLYTGLRRGDAVRLGRQHVKDGVATIKTEKSRLQVEVCIPILPVLAATIAAGPCGDLAFICGERGQPLAKESFGNAFSAACRKAGINKSAHGVRKAGATRLADMGATEAELEAIFGWRGGAMASLYTRAANRRKLAKSGMDKLQKHAG